MKAIVLLSGGLDSTVCMAVARDRGFSLYPISFDYQQRHKRELMCAKRVAEYYNVANHLVIETNMAAIGGSALTDNNLEVPEGSEIRQEIPITYVPGRNLIFLSYALGYAEVLQASHIFIGVNAVDYSGYPDCRGEFIRLFQQITDYTAGAGNLKEKIKIETPLLDLAKKDIVRLGKKLNAPLQFMTSYYNGAEAACGVCDRCVLRLKGFSEAGIADPIQYMDK